MAQMKTSSGERVSAPRFQTNGPAPRLLTMRKWKGKGPREVSLGEPCAVGAASVCVCVCGFVWQDVGYGLLNIRMVFTRR